MKNILKEFTKINKSDYFVFNLLIINIKELFIILIKKNDDQ